MERDPRLPPGRDLAGIDYEIRQEMAAALSRAGRRLDAALRALAAFDTARPAGEPDAEATRRRASLVDAAGEALWHYVVQREACGLRDNEPVLQDLGVPAEVRRRMGYFPRRRE